MTNVPVEPCISKKKKRRKNNNKTCPFCFVLFETKKKTKEKDRNQRKLYADVQGVKIFFCLSDSLHLNYGFNLIKPGGDINLIF